MTVTAAETYAKPDVLVDTEWVAQHLNDSSVRLIESNEDVLLYDLGHIPGALKLDWVGDLNDPLVRDYLHKEEFEQLMGRLGISNDTTVVFYGDKNNWWATYAFWVFQLFGHTNSKVMNGGRKKWVDEGRPLTTDEPSIAPTQYTAQARSDAEIRAFRDEVLQALKRDNVALVDVRSPDEYSGKKLHMPEYPQEGALRGGHIPGAQNIPWATTVQEDGTFKPREELEQIYSAKGVTGDKDVIAYCRIGERSSHSWFVLKYLLGYNNVRNYDGSWTEWGNSVGLPIER
jgi:thiosulfate/3-mercaptopyruvate sulfurtransferase